MSAVRFNWPAFVCVRIDEARGASCGAVAQWRAHPIARSATWWTYCDRCRPVEAERIPDDAIFRVTRLTIEVAAASMHELRTEAAIDAALRVQGALEEAGCCLVRLHVHDQADAGDVGEPEPLRLVLVGPGEPVSRDWLDVGMEQAVGRWRGRRPYQAAVAAGRFQARRTAEGARGRVGGDPRRATEAADAPPRARRRKGEA